MTKTMQKAINAEVELYFNDAVKEYNAPDKTYRDAIPLRYCNAEVIETENYYILRSYNTKIACIDKRTDILYDALRREYGYTATSAQHIAKFEQDYCSGKWTCADKFTWRYI